MRRKMFKSKIHRAVVTEANLDYEGSVTIDASLICAADILPHEHVHIWNVTRGTRIETYVLEAQSESGTICVNGAAAHQNKPGDLVIIASFAEYTEEELAQHRPTIVRVDQQNRIVGKEAERPGPLRAVRP